MSDFARWLLCYHESGHGLAAFVYGAPPRDVDVRGGVDRDTGQVFAGRVRQIEAVPPAILLRIVLAGPLAEVYTPGLDAEKLSGLTGPDADVAGKCLELLGPPEEAHRLAGAAVNEVKALLEKNRRSLSVCAEALARHGRFSAIGWGEIVGTALGVAEFETAFAEEWARQKFGSRPRAGGRS